MERISLTIKARDNVGKQKAKQARREKLLPAVVYGEDINLPVAVPPEPFKTLKSLHFSENTIIDLKIEGYEKEKKTIPVLIKDIQYNPLTEEVIHLDFLKISLKEKVKVNVPIVLKGECKGVIEEGGILEQMLWEIELEALALSIPEKIEVDVSGLDIGDSIHVKDLVVDPGIEILNSEKDTIATVVYKKEEPEEPEEEAEAEEPEVIKEKKEAEEGEEEAGEEGEAEGGEKQESEAKEGKKS
jgi:large subunit ribosomal protein L25